MSRLILYALLWAAIFVGGFGISSTIAGARSLGFVAILISIMLGAVAVVVIRRFPPASADRSREPKPFDLASNRADSFTYFPGAPTGYVGYTDFVAVTVTLNDDLRLRSPEEQFVLTGFARGFVTAVVERAKRDRLSTPTELRVEPETRPMASMLAWLQWVQQHGTDNWGPSTENLQSGLEATSNDLSRSGAIVEKYWDKFFREKENAAAEPARPTENLAYWLAAHDAALKDGRKLALEGQFHCL